MTEQHATNCSFCGATPIGVVEGAIVPDEHEQNEIHGYRYPICERHARMIRPFVYLPMNLVLEQFKQKENDK